MKADAADLPPPARPAQDWPVNRQFEPSVAGLLWSGASGQVLSGLIHEAGRNWVGVVRGNKFTPLNAQGAMGSYDFGAW